MEPRLKLGLAALALLLVCSLGIYFLFINGNEETTHSGTSNSSGEAQILSHFLKDSPDQPAGESSATESLEKTQEEPSLQEQPGSGSGSGETPSAELPPGETTPEETTTPEATLSKDACTELGLSSTSCKDDKETVTILNLEGEEISLNGISFAPDPLFPGKINSGTISRKKLILMNISETELKDVKFTGEGGEIILKSVSFPSITSQKDISSAASIKKNNIGIDSSKYPELNQPARIEFTGVYNLRSAYPLRNGAPCGTYCSGFAYNAKTGKASMEVSGFSNYSIGGINISYAEHLNSTYGFISDITAYVKDHDDNWSEQIPVGDFVRVTFEENLTNGKIIDTYARKGGADNVYFDIYQNGTTSPLLGTSGALTDSGDWQYITLENMLDDADTFDFQMMGDSGGYAEFDYIHDVTNISGCYQINSSGEYALNQSIVGNGATVAGTSPITSACIQIRASNVDFNCNGFNITASSGVTTSSGIAVNGSLAYSRSNITIRNCPRIYNYARGVIVQGVNDSTIQNVTASGSRSTGGFFINQSRRINFDNNTAINNTNYGVFIIYVNDSNFTNNFVNGTITNDGIHAEISNNNSFLNNTVTFNARYGLVLFDRGTNSIMSGNIAYNNTQYGYYLRSSNYNNLSNNTAYNNTLSGFLFIGSNYTRVENSTSFSNRVHGFWIDGSALGGNQNDTFINNNAYNNSQSGFLLNNLNTYWCNLTGNNAYNNTVAGFYLNQTADNFLTNNNASDNRRYDLFVEATTVTQCRNLITGMLSSGGRPINYSNASVSWSNFEASEILLCNADNSVLDNITVNGSDLFSNNGIFLLWTDTSAIKNSGSYSNYYGVSMANAIRNNFTNVTTNGNALDGFFITLSNLTTIANSTTSGNSQNGIYFSSGAATAAGCFNTLLTNNTASYNSIAGFNMSSIGSSALNLTTNLTLNTAYGNGKYGIYLARYHGTNMWNNTLYNNTYDFGASTSTLATTIYMYNTIFTNPYGLNSSGMPENYTNLSVYDALGTAANSYTINWTTNSSDLPAGYFSFAQKFVNISVASGAPSLDSVTWHWDQSEINLSYPENRFELYKYNASGWFSINSTPNTATNVLIQYNMNPASEYGILYSEVNCQLINESGAYTLTSDVTGAPTTVTGIGGITKACVVIAASNVDFTCAGFNITNAAVANAAGIAVNGSTTITYTNITIRNCPAITEYVYGVYASNVTQGTIANVTAYNNTLHGFVLNISRQVNLTNITSYNNTQYGFYLAKSTENNISASLLLDNPIYDLVVDPTLDSECNNIVESTNSSGGRPILYSNSSTTWTDQNAGEAIFCHANGATATGINVSGSDRLNNNGFLIYRTSNAQITNSNSSSNRVGFYATASSDISISSSYASNNTLGGFYFSASNYTSLVNNTAYRNSVQTPAYGFFFASSNYGGIENNTAYGQNGTESYGFYFTSSNDTRLTNNTAYGNIGTTGQGFYTTQGTRKNFTHNTAHNNSVYGFQISDTANRMEDNLAYNNSQYGFRFNADGNTVINNTAYENKYSTSAGFYFLTSSYNTVINNTAYNITGTTGDGFTFEGATFNNVSGNNASNNDNYGFRTTTSGAQYNNFTGNIAYDNRVVGFLIDACSFNNYTGNTAYNNTQHGFFLTATTADSNRLISNYAYGNGLSGFNMTAGDASNVFANNTACNNTEGFSLPAAATTTNLNLFANNTACNNSRYGFYLYATTSVSYVNNLTSNLIYGNRLYGVYIQRLNGTILSNNTFYNNSFDFVMNNTAAGTIIVNMSNSIFTNPYGLNSSGMPENYTNLSLYDQADASSSYSINWSTNSSDLPSGRFSFAQTYVNISLRTATASSINSITWNWDDSQVVGDYNESKFELWKYNSSGWGAALNDTPDTSADTLTIYNHNPTGIYAILQNNVTANCQVISAPGIYTMATDYVGAPNNASPAIENACIVIASSNVSFDCGAYAITNNGTLDAAAIVINSSSGSPLTNITIANCQQVSGYAYGILAQNASRINVSSPTLYNNTYGLYSNNVSNLSVYTGTFRNNTYGFYIEDSENVTGSSASAYSNAYGIYLLDSNLTLLSAPTFYNNTVDFIVNSTGTAMNVNATNAVFRNPYGTLANYTNLSFYDSSSSAGAYYINWSTNSSGTPSAYHYPFAQKYVGISTLSGAVSFESVVWYWQSTETTGYEPRNFQLWEYNSTWTMMNGSPNNSTRTLSSYDMAPAGTYGIFEETPSVLSLILNSTLGTNTTAENLTLYIEYSDDLWVKNITEWYIDDTPLQITNMPFEAGSTTTFTENYGAGSNATVSGATWSATGGYDGWGAYSCDGVNDYIDTNRIPPATAGTINVWFKAPASQTDTWGTIVGQQNTSGLLRTWIGVANTEEKIGWSFDSGSVYWAGGVVNDNTWHMVTLKWGDGSGYAKIYVNAVLTNSTADDGDHTFLYDLYSCGWNSGGSLVADRYFNGYVDELQIYNRSLSDEQILAIYNNQSNLIVSQELAGYDAWKACVTPNDGIQDGPTNCSNTVDIVPAELSGCQLISTSGAFTLNMDATGAPIAVNEVDGITSACVVIAASDVSFNCAGYSITNNGTSNAAAIVINGTSAFPYNNITISNCTGFSQFVSGIHIQNASNVTISGSTTYNNTYGIYLHDSDNSTISAHIFYNNTFDFLANNSGASAMLLNLSSAIFRNPSGTLVNYTNLSIYDSVSASSAYSVNWATNSSDLPSLYYYSFAQKYVNISTLSGVVSIDSAVWSWLSSETTGYRENTFKLWKYNSSGWTMINDTPNTTTHTLSQYAMGPSGIYGILAEVPVISSIILNSTLGTNTTSENLTVYINYSSAIWVKNITEWYIDDSPLQLANMPFEGGSNSTFTRNYGYGSNGTGYNGIAWGATSGYDGWGAYTCTGTLEYLDTGTVPPASAGTINIWFKDAVAGQNNTYGMIAAQDASALRTWIAVRNTDEHLMWGFDSANLIDAGDVVNDNKWHMVTMRWGDGTGSARLYLDGVETSSTADDLSHAFSATLYVCGKNGGAGPDADRYFKGTVDDFQVYNRSLTTAQILAIFQNRTDLIVSNELAEGDIWKACATPNDGFVDGPTNCSNNVTIGGSVCEVISSAGAYSLTQNAMGAPNTVASVFQITKACIVIQSSNVDFSCAGYNITNDGTLDAAGILLKANSTLNYTNVTIRDCPGVSGYEDGIYLHYSSQDRVQNSTAFNNTNGGIYSHETTYSNITDCTAYNNSDGGFRLIYADNLLITGATSYNNTNGFYLLASYSRIENSNAYNNTFAGFLVNSSNTNLTYDNAVDNFYGFYATDFDNNRFVDSNASSNQHGFYMNNLSDSNVLLRDISHGNSQSGIYLAGSTGTQMNNNILYNNGLDFVANDSNPSLNIVYRMYNTLFLNPSGSLSTDYTNISIEDLIFSDRAYSITWASPPSTPPGVTSFENTYVLFNNLTALSAIDNLTWHWDDSQLPGYNESRLQIWKANSTGNWSMVNNTPDVPGNNINAYGLSSAYFGYGIVEVQETAECFIAGTPNTVYTLLADLVGAPNPAPPTLSDSCIEVIAENVTIDCAGYAIVNDGTPNANGIFLSYNTSGAIIKNCRNIEDYTYGVTVYGTSSNPGGNATIQNVTVKDSTSYGFYVYTSRNVTIRNSTARFGSNGFYLLQSNDSLIEDSFGFNNTESSFYMLGSYYNRLDNNTAYNTRWADADFGAFGVTDSGYNNLTNNTAYNSYNTGAFSAYGFFINGNNTVEDNTAYDCEHVGFYSTGYATLIDNLAYGNPVGFSASFSTLTSNRAENNTYGFGIGSNNTITYNYAYNNSDAGFSLGDVSNNTIAFNNATLNGDGFQIYASLIADSNNHNLFYNNTASRSVDFGNFYLRYQTATGNLYENNTAENGKAGGAAGFYIERAANVNLTRNIIKNNTYGVFITNIASQNHILDGNTIYLNTYGVEFDLQGGTSTTFTNNTICNNTYGVYEETGVNDQTYIANTFCNNSNTGLSIQSGEGLVENNTAYGNSVAFQLSGAWKTEFKNNIVFGNTGTGISISGSSENLTFRNTTLCNNSGTGLGIATWSNLGDVNQFYDTLFYNNTDDLVVSDAGASTFYTMDNATFLNPYGTYENYTTLDIDDSIGSSQNYTISWTIQPAPLPPGKRSFANKFVEITPTNGPVSIAQVIWTWTDAELTAGSYNETKFSMWRYNSSSAWEQVAATLNPSLNTLSVFSLNPASDYAILEDYGCPVINSAGSFSLGTNYEGAPNPVPGGGTACFYINASSVTMDCNGYNITNNGTGGGTSAIFVNGGLFSLENCPSLSGYSHGLYVYSASGATSIDNVTAHNNSYGVRVGIGAIDVSNVTVANSVAYNNSAYGFAAAMGGDNTFTSNIACNNSGTGFYSTTEYPGAKNTLTNNIACNNTEGGFETYRNNDLTNNFAYNNSVGFNITSYNNTFNDNSAYRNTYGVYVNGGGDNAFTGGNLYNNTYGAYVQGEATINDTIFFNDTYALYVRSYGGNYNFWMNGASFRNATNSSTEAFTILSITDIVSIGSGQYFVNWSAVPSPLPADRVSFRQKFLNITNVSGAVSIDEVVWHWTIGETSGYNESNFEIWKYNGTWSEETATAGTQKLTQYNLNPASGYGILQNNASENCPIITTSGAYVQTLNYTGAPNSVSGITGITKACVVILASNVSFDCAGFSITNNGTATAAGIFANTSATNITLKNCPSVSSYTHGITIKNLNGGSLTNMTSRNNSVGFNMNNAQQLSLSNNTAYNNTNGFVLESGSNSNNITLSTAHNNTLYGFYLLSASNYNRLSNDLSYNNTYGFFLESSNYNNLTDSDAYNNTEDGYMANNSYDLLLDPSRFHDNKANGVNLNNCNGVTLTDVSASGNNGHGIKMTQATTVVLDNVNVSDNQGHGLHMVQTDDITIVDSTFCSNSQYGIRLQQGTNTQISTSDICSNTQKGAYLVDSSDSTFSDNEVYGNEESGILVYNSNLTYLLREHFYNNAHDLEVTEDAGDPATFNATSIIFDNPAGNYLYFTNLSINDTFNSYSYTINWTANSSALPANRTSFRQKWVNISTQAGAPSIDRVIWQWNTGELSGYTESKFELWKYSGGVWTNLNNTPDTSAHTLALYNLNPASDYGILENELIDANITVYLNSPPNGYITMDTSITFNCSATTGPEKSLVNLTLYGNWSGTWSANQTNTVTGTSNSTTFTKTFEPGTYTWNCLGFDDVPQSDWGNSNFTFTITNATYNLTPLNVTVINTSKYEANVTAGQYELLGGNLTEANANLDISTEKWAGLYGNFSATRVLAENNSAGFMYQWEWNTSAGGEICLTENQSPTWGLLSPTQKAQIDSAWGFEASDSDSANNTLTDGSALLLVAGSINPTTGTYLGASSNFQTGAFKITGAPTNEKDFAFCVNISASGGTNYQNKPVHFEMIVPTSEQYGPGPLETYYVFAELT